MSNESQRHDMTRFMRSGQEEIAEALRFTREALSSPNRDRATIHDLMVRLSELVKAQFRRGKQYVYLEEDLNRARRLRPRAEALWRQHEVLQEQINKLELLVRAGVETPSWWSRIESDFAAFAEQMRAQENAENKLRRDGVSRDLGNHG